MVEQQIAAYFNDFADRWDDINIHDEEKINRILDFSGIKAGDNVLDVACGTGILLPYLLQREVNAIDGIDFAERMIALAQGKWASVAFKSSCTVSYTVADAYCYQPVGTLYDVILVYSAFPHFEKREQLIAHLGKLLKHGGHLVIAHSESRDKINAHHSCMTAGLSWELPEVFLLKEKYFSDSHKWKCCYTQDDEDMYLLVAEKMEKDS